MALFLKKVKIKIIVLFFFKYAKTPNNIDGVLNLGSLDRLLLIFIETSSVFDILYKSMTFRE
jgi:hypothetical protein